MCQQLLISAFLSLLILRVQILAWAPEIQPKFRADFLSSRPNFIGNRSSFFKLLHQEENSILIGTRNKLYNLSVANLKESSNLEWLSSDADREICILKGKSLNDCQNYIRVFAKTKGDEIMICGTNSYKPRCRHYGIKGGNGINAKSMEILSESEAQGRCPYDPNHNSTFIYTDGHLYSGTVADFSGADSIIFRENIRTEQYDFEQLNQPNFVSAIERDGYVFFFYREIAMEYMNCGKAIYSRVGRVCKNDRGGKYSFSAQWTSYLKTRLNCSVPGEYPFYFDEIQATSKLINRLNTNETSIIYSIFTTSINAIPGSAVCAFSIEDILEAFEGNYKSQKDRNSNWLPLPEENVPKPRPGKCMEDSRTLSSASVNFVKTHTLMDTAVPALYGRPLLTRSSGNYRLTAITVDANLIVLSGKFVDVIYVGSTDGKVIKFYNIPATLNNEGIKTVVVSEIQALPLHTPVRELTISHKTDTIIVVGDSRIVSLPLYKCSDMMCKKCITRQDPYCVWDVNNHECTSLRNAKGHTSVEMNKRFVQDLIGSSSSTFGNFCRNEKTRSQHRGTVTGVGLVLNNESVTEQKSIPVPSVLEKDTSGSEIGNDIINETFDSLENEISNTYDNNKITLTSVNPDDLDNTLSVDASERQPNNGHIDSQLQMASGTSLNLLCVILGFCIVFIIGIWVGYQTSKKLCNDLPFLPEHRNQLDTKSRNVQNNLLKKQNAYPLKTDNLNLDHEFVVGKKDRSHECKNSTENLEKEVQCKTSTLKKVKKTYI